MDQINNFLSQKGGIGEQINNMAGGGQEAEKKEDYLDKGIDQFQERVLGQGPQDNEVRACTSARAYERDSASTRGRASCDRSSITAAADPPLSPRTFCRRPRNRPRTRPLPLVSATRSRTGPGEWRRVERRAASSKRGIELTGRVLSPICFVLDSRFTATKCQ